MSELMKGKRGLIMGVANDHSIAWGIAKSLHEQGAELAFTYQGEGFGKRVRPLAERLGSDIVIPCDVEDLETVDNVFRSLAKNGAALISSSMPSDFPIATNSRGSMQTPAGRIFPAQWSFHVSLSPRLPNELRL